MPDAVVDPDDGDIPELRQGPGNHGDRDQRGSHPWSYFTKSERISFEHVLIIFGCSIGYTFLIWAFPGLFWVDFIFLSLVQYN